MPQPVFRKLWFWALLTLAASALAACTKDTGGGGRTASATPGPPEMREMYSGSVRYQEPGVVVIDGEPYTVSVSDSGQLAGFRPGQTWRLTDPNGVEVLAGTILGEFGQWERGVDFVRLDDGRVVAYIVDIDGNWSVHSGEDECRWDIYWANRYSRSPQPTDAADIGDGFRRVAAFCKQELNLAAEFRR